MIPVKGKVLGMQETIAAFGHIPSLLQQGVMMIRQRLQKPKFLQPFFAKLDFARLNFAVLCSAPLGTAALGGLPQVLTPVDGNEPLLQRTTNHAPVAHIKSEHMVHRAENPQVAIGIGPTLAGFNVVEMTGFPFQDMSNPKLDTSKALATITGVDAGLRQLEPDIFGLATEWHSESFAVLY